MRRLLCTAALCLTTASLSHAFSVTMCSMGANNLCAELQDADVRLFISDKSGPFYELNVKLKSVWLSNPVRPTVEHWRNCFQMANSTNEVYSETVVNCDAVGFQGTSLTYAVRAFTENSSVADHHDFYFITPGAFEIKYNLQYGQACVSSEFDCPNEAVNVSGPSRSAACPPTTLSLF